MYLIPIFKNNEFKSIMYINAVIKRQYLATKRIILQKLANSHYSTVDHQFYYLISVIINNLGNQLFYRFCEKFLLKLLQINNLEKEK